MVALYEAADSGDISCNTSTVVADLLHMEGPKQRHGKAYVACTNAGCYNQTGKRSCMLLQLAMVPPPLPPLISILCLRPHLLHFDPLPILTGNELG